MNTICVPSGEYLGRLSWWQHPGWVRRVTCEPSILIVKMDSGFNGSPSFTKTTCEPSGEMSGKAACNFAGVNLSLLVPSAFMIHIAETNPPFWLAYTMFCPSGV